MPEVPADHGDQGCWTDMETHDITVMDDMTELIGYTWFNLA
jgi:hypothetical protein